VARRKPIFQSSQTSLILGIGASIAGVWLIYDAFDGRGKDRPFWVSLFPGG
jgi:uncharacterized membrane protein HdeD (DUF308 family)